MVADTREAVALTSQWERARTRLEAAIEAQRGRVMVWVPVALTFGVWTYFGLAHEPSWIVVAPLAIAAAVLLWLSRRRPALAIVAFAMLGCVLAKTKVEFIVAPVIHATTAERLVTGTVEDRSPSGRGRQIIVIAVDAIAGMTSASIPRRLRLTAMVKQGDVAIGTRIAVKAMLAPLPSPVIPGGFDYGRQLWLDGIGGTGRVVAPIETLAGKIPIRLRMAAGLEGLRQSIGLRVRAVLDGVTAAIAEALITGERSSIPRNVNLSFQVSGLAHVLSISGLHMALAAGGVFWMVRAMLAAIPALALRWPIKKWAAVVALAAGLFYMLLAGSGVATQRSYIMIAVMFFAILVDRPAISVRNLALAAILILALEPDAATQASFQMSFMAVMGLAAYYEFWSDWRRRRDDETRQLRRWPVRLAQKLGAGLLAAIMTTIVAGAMSSIPAAYHFGRMAPFSVLANGLALPVISLIIMPMALAGLVLMPLGLEAWPLWLMGKGIELMMQISDWVAGLPGASTVVHQQSPLAAIIMASGAAILCLLRGPLRLAGPFVVVAGLLLGQAAPMPDILIDRTGATIAFLDASGNLVPAPGRKGGFSVSKWLIANGEETLPAAAAKRPGWSCAADRCTALVHGKSVAYVQKEDGTLDCAGIDILIASFPLRGACKAVPVRIDRFDLWRNGAHGLSINDTGVVGIITARGEAGERPWVVVPEARKDKFQRP